jgi:hypothetical protein
MSTVSLKQFYDQPKKVKFNSDIDKISEISMFEETIPIEKNPDHLSKIIEEDCKTEYGWSKILVNNKNNNTSENKTEDLKKRNDISTVTINSTQIQWDPMPVCLEVQDQPPLHQHHKERPNSHQDETIFRNNFEFNSSLHINKPEANYESVQYDSTLIASVNSQKYNMQQNNYKLCLDISSCNNSTMATNVSTTKYYGNKLQYMEENKTQYTMPGINMTKANLTKTMRDYDDDTLELVTNQDKSKLVSSKSNKSSCAEIEENKSIYKNFSIQNDKSQFIDPNETVQNVNLTLPDLQLPPDLTKSMLKNKSTCAEIEENKSIYKNFSIHNDKSQFIDPNETAQSVHLTLPELQLPPDLTKSMLNNTEKLQPEAKYEILTKEKVDQSMTLNFRKCYNLIQTATGSANLTFNSNNKNNMSISEEFENATKKYPNLCKFIPNVTAETIGYNFTNTLKTAHILNFNESNLEDEGRSLSPINDTIKFSIEDPFNYEYKNRLLARHQDALNEFENLQCFELKKPSVQVKSYVTIGKT